MKEESQYSIDNVILYSITFRDSCFDDIGKVGELKEKLYNYLYSLVNGIVVLSTCNRFEVYLDLYNEKIASDELYDIVGPYSKLFHKLQGKVAIKHLFRVSSGLESAIIGETEILSQIKEAWDEAKDRGLTSKLLDAVFHQSIVVGKRVRSETEISKGVLGYPQASVEIIANKLLTLNGKRIAIIGAGKAAKAMVDLICNKWNPEEITIANRSLENANKLKNDRCKFNVIGLNEIINKEFDVVLIAIKGGPLIFLDKIATKNSFIVDISTPQALYYKKPTFTIDDIQNYVSENYYNRVKQIPFVEKIIEEEMLKFDEYLLKRRIDEDISCIMKNLDELIKKEIEQTKKNIEKGIPVEEALKIAFQSYTKKSLKPMFDLLHENYNNETSKLILDYYKKRAWR
ncbi:MAG: NAD(P)-binding domain-containing protein [Caldisphaera sp.]|nr:MAG: hypothetical protein C0201_04785 [Caldisphaera sp.]